MSTKRPCWSWCYRTAFNHILIRHEFNRLHQFCCDRFGDVYNGYGNRWDITTVARSQGRSQTNYYYTRTKVHFKKQEDFVQFQLSFSQEEFGDC